MATVSAPKLVPGRPSAFNVFGQADLHRGLSRSDEIPSFAELLKIAYDPSGLSPEQRESIGREWNPFKKICQATGRYELVSAELHLKADDRLSGLTPIPHFNSYLFFYGEPAQKLKKVYLEAIRLMAESFPTHEWIVWHPELHDGSHPLISSRLADAVPALAPFTLPISQRGPLRPDPLICLRELPLKTFLDVQRSKVLTKTRITDQIGHFLHHLYNAAAESQDLLQLLAPCRLLVMPFSRPGSRPTRQSWVGDVGGVVFVLVRYVLEEQPEPHWAPIELGRSIDYLLTCALLNESFSAIDIEFERRAVLSSMVHGTVTAIRSIRSSDLSSALSRVTPPKSRSDLRVLLVDPMTGRPDERLSDQVVMALNNAILCEDSAAALLAFSEISLGTSIIRRKFLNQVMTPLGSLLADANIMAANQGSALARPLVLDLAESASEISQWSIPKGYLDAKLIRGIIGELMRNAATYGAAEPDGSVVLTISCLPKSPSEVLLNFTNRRTEVKEISVTGFLARTEEVLQSLNQGVRMHFHPTDHDFTVSLVLGAITAESNGDPISVSLTRTSPVQKT